jgi:DNA-binding MarR family transcriptional regulator
MHIRDFKDDPYLSLLRPLVEAYLAFYRVGNRHIQSLGLTPGQFDVIAELEGTGGLTCGQLSEKTLTTKGTLTGVIDRLESGGFLRRASVNGDRRSTNIQLTPKGKAVFDQVFPVHAEFMKSFFVQALKPSEVEVAKQLLRHLRDSFNGSLSVLETGLDRLKTPLTNSDLPKTPKNTVRTVRSIRKTKGQKVKLP